MQGEREMRGAQDAQAVVWGRGEGGEEQRPTIYMSLAAATSRKYTMPPPCTAYGPRSSPSLC